MILPAPVSVDSLASRREMSSNGDALVVSVLAHVSFDVFVQCLSNPSCSVLRLKSKLGKFLFVFEICMLFNV